MADQDDSYFLHHPDDTGLMLVWQPLAIENFNSWRKAILMALGAKNTIGFVDASIPMPTEYDSLYCSWIHNNNISLFVPAEFHSPKKSQLT